MANDPAYAIQAGVYTALTTSTDLMTIFGGRPRVYDTVPTDSTGRVTAQFPYLTIGDDQVLNDSDQCNESSLTHVKVEAWSRAGGFPEVKQLAVAIRTALEASLTLTGHTVTTHHFENTLYMREPDGLTRRAVVMFRYQTEPSA